MDELKDKQYKEYDYMCRYSNVPTYYNTKDGKFINGIGSNVYKNTEWTPYQVQPTDTLDSIALKMFGNPTYWWIIAYFNDIQDAFIPLYGKYDILKIPNQNSVTFGYER